MLVAFWNAQLVAGIVLDVELIALALIRPEWIGTHLDRAAAPGSGTPVDCGQQLRDGSSETVQRVGFAPCCSVRRCVSSWTSSAMSESAGACWRAW